MRLRLFAAAALFSLGVSLTCAHGSTRLNPGTVRWADEVRHGRADIFFLGDSIVNFGSGGWSNGFAQAAMTSVGLAGSGVQIPWGEAGETQADYTGARAFVSGAVDSTSVGMPSLSPGGKHFRLGSDLSFVAVSRDSVRLDLRQRIDWHLFVAGTAPTAAFGANRSSVTNAPFSSASIQTLPTRNIPTSVSEEVFRFDAAPDNGDWNALRVTSLTADAALYYTKVVLPDSKGVAVSGWGRGGATAQYFRDNYYNHARFTAAGRTQYMRALVAGNSGLLNVAIAFGVNDATQGVTASSFETNVRGLIADVRRDWTAAGFGLGNLSFTLIGAYQVNESQVTAAMFTRLNEYRGVLDGIAAGDSSVSFIDTWSAGPTSQQAVSMGYLADAVHPSALGTQVYGQVLMDQLMPTIGDANIDGHVNFDDLLALARSYALPGTWSTGDFDGTGVVDFDDLMSLAQHYEAPSFPSDWALARSIAPEPGVALGALALVTITSRRRR